MTPVLIYTISILGAAGLYLMLRRPAGAPGAGGERPLTVIGAILGLAAVAWMVIALGRALSPNEERPEAFYTIFTLIALASAVRMITHHRPVYAALYFVLVVLASAGMFLLLAAEFMAFALIIVYAGAILITYMFVLMLAQQAESPQDVSGGGVPEYDRVPREPGFAVAVGFVLIALLVNVIANGTPGLRPPPTAHEARLEQMIDLELMPREFQRALEALEPGAVVALDEENRPLPVLHDDERIFAQIIRSGETEISLLALPDEVAPTNIKRVGLALVWKFPVSLELAGIILLLAMFGAVVLARRHIELSEDELREAAGLRRLAAADDEHERGPRGGGAAEGGGP